MPQIRPNSRQIPLIIDYAGHPDYSDLLYGYLQLVSLPGKNRVRYVSSAEVTGVKLGQVLGITRQTASKKLKGLQELGLVGEKKAGKLELGIFENDEAMLVPMDVLQVLVDTKIPHILSLYVYMLNRYMGAQGEFNYVLSTVKDFIGISSATYSNSYTITEAMEKLDELGLLKYRQVVQGNDTGYKTVQMVDQVTNFV